MKRIELNLGPLGKYKVTAGIVVDTHIDLDNETLKQIEQSASQRGENMQQAMARLLGAGMTVETHRLSGANITQRDSDGQEVVILPANDKRKPSVNS